MKDSERRQVSAAFRTWFQTQAQRGLVAAARGDLVGFEEAEADFAAMENEV